MHYEKKKNCGQKKIRAETADSSGQKRRKRNPRRNNKEKEKNEECAKGGSMKNFNEVFGGKKVFLVVIHVVDYFQAWRNIEIAARAGADGAFLISHGKVPASELIEIYKTIKEEHRSHDMRTFWLGINCLDIGETEIFHKVPADADGIWLDDLGLRLRDPKQKRAEKIRTARLLSKWEGLLFGGVAFKYQEAVPLNDLAELCWTARDYTDVITTSGDATGKAPELKKIQLMNDAIGSFPSAIASGMTPENVKDYIPYVHCILAATGISKSFTEFDPAEVRAMAQNIHAPE